MPRNSVQFLSLVSSLAACCLLPAAKKLQNSLSPDPEPIMKTIVSQTNLKTSSNSQEIPNFVLDEDDDDFQNPTEAIAITQTLILSSIKNSLTPTSSGLNPPQKRRKSYISNGKENRNSTAQKKRQLSCSLETGSVKNLKKEDKLPDAVKRSKNLDEKNEVEDEKEQLLSSLNSVSVNIFEKEEDSCNLEEMDTIGDEANQLFDSTECLSTYCDESNIGVVGSLISNKPWSTNPDGEKGFVKVDKVTNEEITCLKIEKSSCYSNSIESRLLQSRETIDDFEPGTQLNEMINLCCEMGDDVLKNDVSFQHNGLVVECPLCSQDISDLNEELRQVHTNNCLDKAVTVRTTTPDDENVNFQQVAGVNPVIEWLRSLGLSKYEDIFIKEEVDWETLQWLTEEDLLNIGIVALGPRKKIVNALSELRKNSNCGQGVEKNKPNIGLNSSKKTAVAGNKLITEFFLGPSNRTKIPCNPCNPQQRTQNDNTGSTRKKAASRKHVCKGKVKDIPPWCCVPGTPFKVDAFRFLRGDCSYWFLTHFHMDHYQGLTRSFCHGKIYCSSITAHLVNMKIGVPWERIEILPMNQKITIGGVNITCLDANHCPGSIIILFEPPNGKAVLHTGDFRFSSEMACSTILRSCPVHTLILDTTYCNPQYNFPKQEAVIQFVIEAIQAEAFNPKTLFLIGTYTIGKERLFLEVARLLKKKIYVGAAKLRLLKCLGLCSEDMQWFTENDLESHIHVVPMWTIASFKRMKHLSNQYSNRFNLIVGFSPTGWTFGKGKKKTPGRRWQQGTIVRYEVPYSEHSSFSELKEFVRLLSPEHIIPSVNNEGPESADSMIALLTSDT